MERSGKRERSKRAVGRDTDIVRFGHRGDLFRLGYPAGVGDIGLDDVDAAELKVWPDVFAGEQALAELLQLVSYLAVVQEDRWRDFDAVRVWVQHVHRNQVPVAKSGQVM
jgi:hypothetical protein